MDVPEINQVIMLRPTQSPVVFIQQLGRGLRKTDDKEYVVILDFIGNYMNNFMIPIALSGDRSYNKDGMRRYVREGSRIIPGSSTIHFDEVSKRRIYASIDQARTNDMKLLKESYQSLKFKLGRIPTMMEFKTHGAIDMLKIFEKCGSYHAFLKKAEPDYQVSLTSEEETIIEYLCKKVVSYKRIDETALLLALIKKEQDSIEDIRMFFSNHYGMMRSEIEVQSAINNLTNLFPKEAERKKYHCCVLIEKDVKGKYGLSQSFKTLLINTVFKEMIKEILLYSKVHIEENYSDRYKDTAFVLYQKYNYEDVCRLLGWQKNMNAQNIGGYFYDAATKTLPVFINYDKAEDAIAYEDRFISENQLIALSKHPRNINSADVTHIYKRSEADRDNRIYLFVRKNKDDNEAKEFYFLGEIEARDEPKQVYMKKTKDLAFEIMYHLDVPVRSDIYDYIVRD